MGGSGSGNRYRYGKKDTLNNANRLDIRNLKKWGMLNSGSHNIYWTWGRDRKPNGNVNFRVVAGESMTVIYRWRNGPDREWQPVERTVSFAHTACAFGGSRLWFVCPCCSCRVVIVVVDGPNVACRHCLKLTYASCNEDQIDRSWRKRDKIEDKLGGDNKGLYMKPKGMHQRTWERLKWQHINANLRGFELLEERLDSMRGSFY